MECVSHGPHQLKLCFKHTILKTVYIWMCATGRVQPTLTIYLYRGIQSVAIASCISIKILYDSPNYQWYSHYMETIFPNQIAK